MAHGVRAVVVTRGAAGVSVRERTGDGVDDWSQPAFVVDARDTTGAGDAFCGVLAAGLAGGGSLASAVRGAAAAGALAATVAGAVPSLPSRRRIDELLSAGPDATAPAPPTRTPR
jgi:ribokinase